MSLRLSLSDSLVVFGVSLSPFLLNETLHHVKKYAEAQPMVVGKLLKSIYIADVVGGADTAEQAHKFYKQSKQMLTAGSFNLQKFMSNLPSLQAKVEQEEPPSTPLHTGGTEPLDETYAGASLPGNTTL